VAVDVARRKSLPLPVPITTLYADAPATLETEWQERVVRHLGLSEWARVEIGDELDLVGPVAQAALRRHGLLHPLNAHSHGPLLERARGGALMTGIDGDGLLDGWIWLDAAQVLGRHARPRPRDALRAAKYFVPAGVATRVFARRLRRPGTWLQPGAADAVVAAEARELADEPRDWPSWVCWWRRRRYLSLNLESLDLLAADSGARISHPLADPVFVSAVAASGGRFGPGGRTAVMRSAFGDLLPDDVLDRQTKATFGEAFFRRHTRDFAAHWDGKGVDDSLVDVERLRAEWLKPEPHVNSGLLLQSAWLAAQPRG
jgi:asparagine synthase (glutamine-hydrolysing)